MAINLFDMITSSVPSEYLTESICNRIDTIQVCLEAVNDGIADQRTIDVASSYSKSMVNELLDMSEVMMLKEADLILTRLNNFNINCLKPLQRYRNVVSTKIEDMKLSWDFHTYQYPRTDYPNNARVARVIDFEVYGLQKKLSKQDTSPDDIKSAVDDMLKKLGEQMLGKKTNLDNIRDWTKFQVEKNVRGREKTVKIDSSSYDDFVDDIPPYKTLVSVLRDTKTDIKEYHQKIKEAYAVITTESETYINKFAATVDPKKTAFIAKERTRFSRVISDVIRLFNGYITIYQSAFQTKLYIIKERIDAYREIINTIFKDTGIFAAINTMPTPTTTNSAEYKPMFLV